jgi:hypothetical protein
MAPVSLPQSIDAATAAVASEVQQNFEALRDAINGDIEGGTGNNLKADGVTAREIEGSLLRAGGVSLHLQEGVYAAGDLKVTPGAGLVLAYATGLAMILDDNGLVDSASTLVPANVTGSTVTIAANASGNPRIDQVVLTLTGWNTGTVSVVQGTATGGATLDNRTGAAALPAGAIRLADILMPTGFAGPFVQNTHIRDRRPWMRGADYRFADTTSGNAALGAMANISAPTRLEASGAHMHIEVRGHYSVATSAAARLLVQLLMDGSTMDVVEATQPRAQAFGTGSIDGGASTPIFIATWDFVPTAGSHLFQLQAAESTNDITIQRAATVPLEIWFKEHVAAALLTANNSGA